MKTNLAIAAAVATLMTTGVIDTAEAADKAKKEKCYGVVKAGKNDCGNASKSHSCAGFAEADSDGGEWVTVPEGLCEKLAGGSLEPVAADADEGMDKEH